MTSVHGYQSFGVVSLNVRGSSPDSIVSAKSNPELIHGSNDVSLGNIVSVQVSPTSDWVGRTVVSVVLDPRDTPVEFTMLHLIAPRFILESSCFQSPVIVVSTHVDRLKLGGDRSLIVSDGYGETVYLCVYVRARDLV